GHGAGEHEMILVDRVRRQFGLPQDVPPPFPQYKRDDVERPMPLPQPDGADRAGGV
ncbi:hypothetical protein KI387_040203, partial [Taxus chinensis]